MRNRLRSVVVREDGIAMILVVIITAFLSMLAVTLIDSVKAESDRGAHANWSSTSFEAAEAGLDDYTAKLVDDHGFYLHYVHPAEATRSPSTGVNAPHSSDCTSASGYSVKTTTGVPWTYGTTWTYPNGKDNWCQLPNGYYYNLQVFAPGTATNSTTSVRIVATGRRSMSSTQDMRAIETYVRPSNLTDFYRFSDGDVSIDAETFGKIYSNGNVSHTGHGARRHLRGGLDHREPDDGGRGAEVCERRVPGEQDQEPPDRLLQVPRLARRHQARSADRRRLPEPGGQDRAGRSSSCRTARSRRHPAPARASNCPRRRPVPLRRPTRSRRTVPSTPT